MKEMLSCEEEEEELTAVAELPLPAVRTEALEGVDPVDAGPSIPAGVAGAVIDVCRKRTKSNYKTFLQYQ